MPKRTLTSTWKNIERLVEQHKRRLDNRKLEELNDLLVRVNKSSVVTALATLFVNPYHGLEETGVLFEPVSPPENGEKLTKVYHVPEENRLYVNVLGVLDFRQECEEARENLATPEARESFYLYRHSAFLAELVKLPSRLLLFLLILEEVANVRDVSRVDKRGSSAEEPEGRAYLQLLWGFKELENFMYRNTGVDLRSEYSILWQESNWFLGR